jgi:hypothetical protein
MQSYADQPVSGKQSSGHGKSAAGSLVRMKNSVRESARRQAVTRLWAIPCDRAIVVRSVAKTFSFHFQLIRALLPSIASEISGPNAAFIFDYGLSVAAG